MELPERYRERMRGLLGAEYGDYLAALDEPRSRSLRINTGKWTEEEAERRLDFLEDPVPWAEGGYYYREEARPARHPAYYAGLYYLQEASAMSPGAVLPVEPGNRVLDLCAAPGGKATQAAAKLAGKGVLYANDVSASRAQALLKNLEMAGVANCFVTAETPERLAAAFPEYFDRILVDAPCSGEGMFRKDSSLIRDWEEKGPSHYAPVQAAILEEAGRMLRPGGTLLYSTCTFAPEEDEGNVEAFLDRHPDMRVRPISPRPGFSPGLLPGTVRLWPHRTHGEGHFLALLEKKERPADFFVPENIPEPAGRRRRGKKNRRQPPRETPPDFPMEEKTAGLLKGWERTRRDDVLYALPPGEKILPGIRYLRTGLRLGEWKRKRFLPAQALAMACSGYPDRVSFPWGDGRILRYLKGETVDAAGAEICGEEGWCLVCMGEHPLGWAVRKGTGLKNKYYPGWRWQ